MVFRTLIFLSLCAAITATSMATAADPITQPARAITPKGERAAPSGDSRITAPGNSLWTTASGLLAVVGLIVAGGLLLHRQLPGAPGVLPKEALQILGRRNLEYKQVIHLVRCGTRLLVLGSSPAGLTTLAEITDPLEVDTLTGLCQTRDPDAQPAFAQVFSRFLGAAPNPAAASANSSAPAAADPAASRLRDRLHQAPAYRPFERAAVSTETGHGS